tara:strand:+ start:12886 stop:13845 length:960 start_codon:yes stop_codon:yes gene_type:complete
MVSLLILAYNEEKNIETTISSYINNFDEIIIVNDSSTDKTKEIIENINKKNEALTIINNSKNYGAGKSFQIGINHFLKSESTYLIKIDGDGQFNKEDILNIKTLVESNKNFDLIKCDRFWSEGIIGNIPTVRYIGNIFASILIKFSTGFKEINDPLNGLFLISNKLAKNIDVPKIFYRYGYPFYLIILATSLSLKNNIKIGQIKNTVTYGFSESKLRPSIMLLKLIFFSLKSYLKKIRNKINYSELQTSFAIDLISLLFLSGTIYQLIRFIKIRFFESVGSQSAWFTVFIIFAFLTVLLFRTSLKIENRIFTKYFEELN